MNVTLFNIREKIHFDGFLFCNFHRNFLHFISHRRSEIAVKHATQKENNFSLFNIHKMNFIADGKKSLEFVHPFLMICIDLNDYTTKLNVKLGNKEKI